MVGKEVTENMAIDEADDKKRPIVKVLKAMTPRDFVRDFLVYKLPPNYRPVLPIFGGFLIMLTFGTLYTQGNLNPYMLSYMRQHEEPDITIKRMTWLVAFQVGFPLSMVLGGLLGEWIGLKPAAIVGCVLVWVSMALTYYTVQSVFLLTMVTNGILLGFGAKISANAIQVCGMRWLPKRPGLVNGLLVAGIGLGSFIFSPIQTAFVNPNNYSPNCGIYFCQPDLLANVTSVFLVLAICYAILDIVGLIFLCSPKSETPENDDEDTPLLRTEVHDDSIGPIEALKSSTFWSLAVAYLCNVSMVFVMTTYWKTYGQTFIRDDFFLSAVSSVSSVCNCLGRIFWGFLADKFSFQIVMAVASCIQAILTLTLIVTTSMHKIFFLVWICAIYFCFSSNYSLYPMATMKCFGRKHVGVNYGMLYCVYQLSFFALSLVSELLFDTLGYLGIFIIAGVLSLITFALTVTIQWTKFGKYATRSGGN